MFGEIPSGSKNGTNTVFTLAHLPTVGTVTVYRNGLREHPGVGYTVSGTALTFSTAPLADDDIFVDYLMGS